MPNNLFPIGYEAEVITDEDASEDFVGYRPGVAFDYILGDFVRDGRNALIDNTGIESWKSWCINCLSTERYKHLAYSTDWGIDVDPVFKAASREEAQSILTREINEALLADPYQRTEYIEELSFDWTAPDAVLISLKIRGIEDVTIDISVYLAKEQQGGA